MKNTILLTVVSVLLILGFLFAAYKLTNAPQAPQIFAEVSTIGKNDHAKWADEKKHILVEYSDLQCPACKNFHDYITQELEATSSGKTDVTREITFVYRHFPLTDIHEHAQEAAQAAEAAGKQGKFFEYVDRLFDTQTEWESLPDTEEYFLSLATELKLDPDKFKEDAASQEVKDKIQKDYQSGLAAQVNATPTFYLNGEKLVNIRSYEEFRAYLEKTITVGK